MSDFVKKEDAIRICKMCASAKYRVPYIEQAFENISTIDAVSVVRCKECMFSKVYQNDRSGVMGRFCEAFTQVRMVSDDDFCSYGESKESE